MKHIQSAFPHRHLNSAGAFVPSHHGKRHSPWPVLFSRMIEGKKGEFPWFLEFEVARFDSSSGIAITNAAAEGGPLSTLTSL